MNISGHTIITHDLFAILLIVMLKGDPSDSWTSHDLVFLLKKFNLPIDSCCKSLWVIHDKT